MNTHIRYNNAPIVEAIIDFRVLTEEDLSIDDLEQDFDIVKNQFPKKETMYEDSILLEQNIASRDVKVDTSRQKVGLRFISADEKRIFQVSPVGFTINRLKPYTSWEPFRDEAKELWALYKRIVQPRTIQRIGVRFINRFEFPAQDFRLQDYLSVGPSIAPGLGSSVNQFFMQLHLPQADLGCMLIVNQVTEQSQNAQIVPIILDFDLFTQQSWPLDNEAAMWVFLEQLRQRKNQAFNSSMTTKTKELIS